MKGDNVLKKVMILVVIFLLMGCAGQIPIIKIPEIRIDAPPKINIEIPFKIMKKGDQAVKGGVLVEKDKWEAFRYAQREVQNWMDDIYLKAQDFNAKVSSYNSDPVVKKRSKWKFWEK